MISTVVHQRYDGNANTMRPKGRERGRANNFGESKLLIPADNDFHLCQLFLKHLWSTWSVLRARPRLRNVSPGLCSPGRFHSPALRTWLLTLGLLCVVMAIRCSLAFASRPKAAKHRGASLAPDLPASGYQKCWAHGYMYRE